MNAAGIRATQMLFEMFLKSEATQCADRKTGKLSSNVRQSSQQLMM